MLEVVDFAVEDDADRSVFVVDGLPAAAEVDDAQAAHAQHGERLGEYAVLIGPAVNHRGHHPAHASFGESLFTADRAADSAHAVLLYRGLAPSSTAACANQPLFAAKSQRVRRALHKQGILRMMQVSHGE